MDMRVLTVNPSRRMRRVPPVHEATGGHAVNTLMSLKKSSIFLWGLQRKDTPHHRKDTLCRRKDVEQDRGICGEWKYIAKDGCISRQVDRRNGVRRPRLSRKSVPDGILKMPTDAKIQKNRGRWSKKCLPSTMSAGAEKAALHPQVWTFWRNLFIFIVSLKCFGLRSCFETTSKNARTLWTDIIYGKTP